jgi:hypothetical protein
MAKKKSSEKTAEVREVDAGSPTQTTADAEAAQAGAIVEASTPGYVAAEELWLVAEVQAFLSKRGELAEKLAREIEATEKKLAELKRTAALLNPAASVEAARDKKAKKPTLKKKPERKTEANAQPTESPAENQSADESQP